MVICHSETLARSGQAAAISGKRFFVSQKVCFAIKLPKFSAARAKEQEATFIAKRGAATSQTCLRFAGNLASDEVLTFGRP